MSNAHKNIETIKISSGNSKLTAYMVKAGGKCIGFIEKWKNTRTEENPWKAYGARYNTAVQGYQYAPENFFATYFEKNGKDISISALLANAVHNGPYVFTPEGVD